MKFLRPPMTRREAEILSAMCEEFQEKKPMHPDLPKVRSVKRQLDKAITDTPKTWKERANGG